MIHRCMNDKVFVFSNKQQPHTYSTEHTPWYSAGWRRADPSTYSFIMPTVPHMHLSIYKIVIIALQVGGGPTPNSGDFVGAHFKVSDESGRVLLDTRETGRPIAFTQVWPAGGERE